MSFNFYHIIRNDDFFTAGGSQPLVVTRENYEAYFVMYIDNELTPAQRKAVDYFIQQNPDLEEELVMLQQSVLRPDEKIVFTHKEHLLKNTAAQGSVNENNYEEYFVLYGDDELTTQEKIKVEQFVVKHPQYAQEFELIQQAKLVPDTIIFPDKAYLFRTEEDDNRVIAFPWWRISAAAIALLVIGSLGWYLSAYNTGTNPSATGKLATTQPKQSANANATASKAGSHDTVNTTITNNTNTPTVAAAPVNTNLRTTENNAVTRVQQAVARNEKKNISKPSNIQPAVNVQPVNETNVMPDTDKETAFTAKPVQIPTTNTYTPTVVNNTTITKEASSVAPKTTTPVVTTVAADETNNQYASNTTPVINKTPLRGFLRKVSRVVDRVTNPDENNKKGLRIANLEIALN